MKLIAWTVVVLFLASPSRAAETPWLAGIIAANAADLVSTEYAIRIGAGVEGNPLLRHAPARYGLKSAVTSLQVALVHQLWRDQRRKAAIITSLAFIGGNGFIASHNLWLTTH